MRENLVRFSVVISTFNQQILLLETLESVIRQTYQADEIIVVADGCSDGTADAVRQHYPQVRIIEQPNLGKSIARNTGIIAAASEWICLLDHDDLWHPDKLARVAEEILGHPDCAALAHPVWYFSAPGGPTSGFGFSRDFEATTLIECAEAARHSGEANPALLEALDVSGDSFERYLARHIGPLSAVVIRRDILMRAGLFCPMQFNGEDWTTFVNVSRLTNWVFIRQRLGFTRFLTSSGSYEATGSLMLLATQVNAWFGGRPLRRHTANLSFLQELDRHRARLRREIQHFYWEALIRRQWQIARNVKAFAGLLLQHRSDRIYILLPPQLTWHFERWMLGRYKSSAKPSHDSNCSNTPQNS